jgi:hypothetical protein
MPSTMIDLSDKITYFSDQSDMISMVIIIIVLLIPITFHIYFRERNILLLNPLSKDLLRNISLLFLSYICALLFGLIYRLSHEDGTISIHGSLSYANFNADCSDNDFSCCNYYDNCRISEGREGPIDHDTIIIPVKRNSECPHLSEILYKRDEYLDYDSHDCSESEFGCCMIRTTCDSYVRLNFSYSLYEHTIGRGPPIGYVTSMESKIDEIGSNCPVSISAIVDDYAHLHVVSQSHQFAFITLSLIGIIILCLGICIRNHIMELNYNTLSEEEENKLDSPENDEYP